MAHENVIEMHEITKIFGEFVANDKINLNLRRGEIRRKRSGQVYSDEYVGWLA